MGEMLTRSRSASSASFCASREDITPSWLPSSATNLTSGSLICSLMSGSFAIGFSSLFVESRPLARYALCAQLRWFGRLSPLPHKTHFVGVSRGPLFHAFYFVPPFGRNLVFRAVAPAASRHPFDLPSALRFARVLGISPIFPMRPASPGSHGGPFSRLSTRALLSSLPPDKKSGQHTPPAKIPTNTSSVRYLTVHTFACR